MPKKKGNLKKALAQHLSKVQRPLPPSSSTTSSLPSTTTIKEKKTINPFTSTDTILLVGEGNFSFTVALVTRIQPIQTSQIIATVYDTLETCYQKYPDAQKNVQLLQSLGVIVLFQVDAGGLHKNKTIRDRKWDKIYFGFPHVGAGHKDETRNILSNQLLLLRFLISAAPLLVSGRTPTFGGESSSSKKRKRSSSFSPEPEEDSDKESEFIYKSSEIGPTNGSILITLRNAIPYTHWNLPMLAKKLPQVIQTISNSAPPVAKGISKPTLQDVRNAGIQIDPITTSTKEVGKKRYKLWRSFEFIPSDWIGYQHRRTIGWVNGKSTDENHDLLRSRQNKPIESKNANAKVRASRAGGGECRMWQFGLDG